MIKLCSRKLDKWNLDHHHTLSVEKGEINSLNSLNYLILAFLDQTIWAKVRGGRRKQIIDFDLVLKRMKEKSL